MGRRGDMPRALAPMDRHSATPWVAVLAVGGLVAALTLIGSVKTTWSFSAFTVLIYYAITNASALVLPRELRLFPRWIPALGLISCLLLAFFVSWGVWAVGLALLAAGLGWHHARRVFRLTSRPEGD